MKVLSDNPFVTIGYAGKKYFCDRKEETDNVINLLTNGNNVALISPRRMGKSGLIKHCFEDERIRGRYLTFYIDIYATSSQEEFIATVGKEIVEQLKPAGVKALETFSSIVKSLQSGISFDVSGNPSFTLQPGEIRNCRTSISEIFEYLEKADRPCIVAIDEFQQISEYPEKNTEALLRTYIQNSNNARFIFSGSERHMMSNIFLTSSRPFYQSSSMMGLMPIPKCIYYAFAQEHLSEKSLTMPEDVFQSIYDRFDGVTWYIQKMLNTLYMLSERGRTISYDDVDSALKYILDGFSYNYMDVLSRIPQKQRKILVAIANEGKARALTGTKFIRKYSLGSASSVQGAVKGLLKSDFITSENNEWYVYDYFFGLWLQRS